MLEEKTVDHKNMKKITFFTIIALLLVSISVTSVSAQNQYEIPSWVKGVAGFWSEGKISDADFGEGLAFLIDNEIIKIPKIQELQDKVSTLQSENANLRSKLNLPQSVECGDNQIEQNGICRDIICGPNQIWQNNQCQDVVVGPKNNLNLQTDKVLYGQGDLIIISGLIQNIENLGSSDVSIIVRAPDNSIVAMAQVHPNANGSFQMSLKADGPQFITAGNYAIFANFSGLKSEIKFKFTGGDGGFVSGGETPITCPSGQTLVNGKCVSITISVTTDKSKYNEGDTIMVTGRVTSILVGVPISLIVTNPNGERVILDQLGVDLYGKFSTKFTAGGPLMRDSGIYTIEVTYGSQTRTSETTFSFAGSSDSGPKETKMAVAGTEFMVSYKITGGNLISITPDVEANSLIIAITASQDGSLVITLPRSLIDAKMGAQDDAFFVLIDGKQVGFEETTTSTDRTLTIQFPAGANKIEIIGTFAVS